MPSGIYKRTKEMKTGKHSRINVPEIYCSKKWLSQKYITEELSSQQIANIVQVDRKTIDQWLAKYQIKKRGCGGSKGIKSRKWLLKEYIKEGKSLNDLAKQLRVDRKAIHQWLIGYNIPRHSVGDSRKGKDSPWWKGGKYKDHTGYIGIYNPNHPNCSNRGYVKEHRLVVEKVLGRYLFPEEIIHHINCIRDDNRTTNLYLFSSSSEHGYYHQMGTEKLMSNLIKEK